MIIDKIDFNCISEIANHCDMKKLCIAINEANDFDLSNLFCDDWNEILDIIKEVKNYELCTINCTEPTNYALKLLLINGGSYIGCNDKKRNFLGIKRIFVYYSYARYILINGYNDTPNGMVSKTNDFSLPIPLKELQAFSEKYRNMGYESFKKLSGFLCLNKDIFDFNGLDCGDCGCSKCNKTTSTNGFSISGKIIRK